MNPPANNSSPIHGLIHILAKAAMEDYRRELAKKEENESRDLRTVQLR